MPKARLDLEKDKFDSEGRVKVSIENVNTTGSDQDVIVKNTSSEPVPVSIVNPDDNIDIQVEIQPNITIDDSTPIDVNVTNTSVDVNITALDGDGDLGVKIQNTNDIDVNVTNASVNTNATIQNANIDVNLTDLNGSNRLPVSVDNQPTVTVDSSTPVDVNVTNTVSTNATIQNAELDVNVTNPFQYVYDMVYDGSQWRFQLSDSNGKAINLDRTYYTSSDITTMGASSDINVWLAAYNDSMLTKKYVATWDAEYEQDVYLQHPSLSSGNCLHLIYQYTTQNSVKVLESVWAKIDTWSYDDEIAGTVSITAGTVTSPAVDAAAGTDVCTLTATNNSIGDIVVSLSGTNASLYQLNDGVTTGSSITNPSAPLIIETASTFSGASYSHSVTATITGSTFSVTDSVTVETSGTATPPQTWANDYYARSNTTTSSVVDYRINGTEKSLWPSLSTGNNTFPPLSSAWAITFWLYMPSSGSTLSSSNRECLLKTQIGSAQGGMQVFMRGTNTLECYIAGTTAGNRFYGFIGTGFSFDAWNLITINYDGNYGLDIYANDNTSSGGGSVTGSASTINSQLSNATINNTEIMSFVYTPAGGSSVSRANRFYRIDELTAYNIQLNSTQRSEVYNSGTPKDPSTLSFASNVESYFRFGDGSSDSLANYYAYDDNDGSRYFEPITAGTRDFTAY